MAEWSIPPAEFKKQIILQLRHTVQVVVFNFVRRVIERTPRLSGQLANNWQTALHAPSSTTIIGPSEGSVASYQSLKIALDGYMLGDRITLRNNLPYAARIEFDGWSRMKAPEGMLRITMAEWPQIVQQGVMAVKAGE